MSENFKNLLPAKGLDALNVVIVGAGIAGLSAAIALRRGGHNITILERSSMTNEVGAAIHVCPNASRILLSWGLDPVRARFVATKSFMMARADTMESVVSFRDPDLKKKYGADLYYAHRVDLHDELKKLALDVDGPGKPPEIRLRADVVGYEPENGIVKLGDGSEVRGDLIIGADGIHSIAVETVLGRKVPAVSSGTACFRFLIPTENILKDPESAPFMANADSGFRIFVADETDRLVWYPCRDNTVQNGALLVKDTDEILGNEDWNRSATEEVLMEKLKNFHPLIKAACRKANDIKMWKLLFRDPLPIWHRSRLVIIGDAAHPMLPHQGQAGAMAIEDSAALGRLFENFEDKTVEAISKRLDLFEKIRKNRASAMQTISRYGQDQIERCLADASKYIPREKLPRNQVEIRDFNFVHSVVKSCEDELKLLAV